MKKSIIFETKNDTIVKDKSSVKLVVVGSNSAQKTKLLMTGAQGKTPDSYIPTVFDNHSTDITVMGKKVSLGLWDTSGQEDYDRLRPLSYPGTSIFLIAISLGNPEEFIPILKTYYREIIHHCGEARILLVGTRSELRENKDKKNVDYDTGLFMAKEIGAFGYFECSADKNEGVKELFQSATEIGLGLYDDVKKSKKKLFLGDFFSSKGKEVDVNVKGVKSKFIYYVSLDSKFEAIRDKVYHEKDKKKDSSERLKNLKPLLKKIYDFSKEIEKEKVIYSQEVVSLFESALELTLKECEVLGLEKELKEIKKNYKSQ